MQKNNHNIFTVCLHFITDMKVKSFGTRKLGLCLFSIIHPSRTKMLLFSFFLNSVAFLSLWTETDDRFHSFGFSEHFILVTVAVDPGYPSNTGCEAPWIGNLSIIHPEGKCRLLGGGGNRRTRRKPTRTWKKWQRQYPELRIDPGTLELWDDNIRPIFSLIQSWLIPIRQSALACHTVYHTRRKTLSAYFHMHELTDRTESSYASLSFRLTVPCWKLILQP